MILFALALSAVPVRAQKSVPSAPVVVKRVGDPQSWKKLRDRVMKKPGVRQSITVEGKDYQILSIVSSRAFSGQQCPAGTEPRNAVHFTVPAPAEDSGIYPVRITAACVMTGEGDSSSRDLLVVDADADGKILDIAVYNGSLSLSLHPTAEPVPVPGDTQTSNLASMLGRLLKHLADAP